MGYSSWSLFFERAFFHSESIHTDNQITLELDNGEVFEINPNSQNRILNKKGQLVTTQKNTLLSFKGMDSMTGGNFNFLKIPNGKKMDVELSDGTIVHLNSGSTFNFPSSFIGMSKRSVRITGEGFFDVTKDAARPFIVQSDELNVEVLGTKFNISNYPEDQFANVVLLEGSVSMYDSINNSESNIVLTPGWKGSYDNLNRSIKTQEVVPEIYTSWMDGRLIFRNQKFQNILRKLERHYNVKIISRNDQVANETFSASFNEAEVVKVLEYFKNNFNIKYSIDDEGTIVIK